MPDGDERLFAAGSTSGLPQPIFPKGGVTTFWLYPGLQSRSALSRIIELQGGAVRYHIKLADVALVPTSSSSRLSAALYSKLLDCVQAIVDPSWLLDSVEHGKRMCEQDYMGFEPDTDNTDAAGDDGVSEVDKEAGEFLLDAILCLCEDDKEMSWPDIYTWCAKNHGSKNTVDYWRSLNSPGYRIYTSAMALREEMRDSSNNSGHDLKTLLKSARIAYPTHIAPPTQPLARTSEAKGGKCSAGLHQHATPPLPQYHKASQPARAYSMDEERAGLKDLLVAQSSKPDFAPWSYRWWQRFEPLFPGRSCRELHSHYRNADELRSIADSVRQGNEPRANAVSSPVNRVNYSSRVGFTPEELSALRNIIISERDKPDFNPRSRAWWNQFTNRIPTRSGQGLHKRWIRDPELMGLVPVSHRHKSSLTINNDYGGADSDSGSGSGSDSTEDKEDTGFGAQNSNAGKREPRLRYTDKEFKTMKAIIDAERGKSSFDPHNYTWWERFTNQFRNRTAAGLCHRYGRGIGLATAVRRSTSRTLRHKRKRSEGYTGNTSDDSTGSSDDEDGDEDEDDEDEDEEDEDLDDNALILKMVSGSDTTPNSWSTEDIERILSCVKPGTHKVSRSGLNKVAARYGRSYLSWKMKWVRNEDTFRRIIDYRRSRASPPSGAGALAALAAPASPNDRPSKRARTGNDEPDAALGPATPPLTVTPLMDDKTDEPTSLRHAVIWFLESISKKKPANDGEILAVWTAISTAKGPSITSLMKIYYTNLDLFELLLCKC